MTDIKYVYIKNISKKQINYGKQNIIKVLGKKAKNNNAIVSRQMEAWIN